MIYLWRTALALLVLVAGWRIIATGLAEFYGERLAAGDAAAVDQVLTWAPAHPEALLAEAVQVRRRDPQRSAALLARAYQANPADPRPLMIAATALSDTGEPHRADALMELAARLAPVDPQVHEVAAIYWDERGEPQRALRHLSRVLEADPRQRARLYRVLLALAEDPARLALLEPYAAEPPNWWEGFFAFAAREAFSAETVRLLYNLRRQSASGGVSEAERSAYLARLQREGLTSEAYLVWINGLDAEQRAALGLLYNGGFELALSNEGFGWHLRPHRRLEAETLSTEGALGQRALRLRLHDFEGHFSHLQQPLFLEPGTYRLSGRVQSEGLHSRGGLRWQVRCRLPEVELLGESVRWLGATDGWSEFAFGFEVPEDCRAQQLRLVSAGQRRFELKVDGALWFDGLQIRRTAALDAAARADALMRGRDTDDETVRGDEGNAEAPGSLGAGVEAAVDEETGPTPVPPGGSADEGEPAETLPRRPEAQPRLGD